MLKLTITFMLLMLCTSDVIEYSEVEGKVLFQFMALCSGNCEREKNNNCTGKCISFRKITPEGIVREETTEQLCWETDNCGQFPRLYEFVEYDGCESGTAVWLGQHMEMGAWKTYPILECIENYPSYAPMIDGVKLFTPGLVVFYMCALMLMFL